MIKCRYALFTHYVICRLATKFTLVVSTTITVNISPPNRSTLRFPISRSILKWTILFFNFTRFDYSKLHSINLAGFAGSFNEVISPPAVESSLIEEINLGLTTSIPDGDISPVDSVPVVNVASIAA